MFGIELGLFALIGLILVVWAGIEVMQSSASPFGKALWIVFVLVAPVLGFIIWFFFGPRSSRRR
jgi:hypothetical protein